MKGKQLKRVKRYRVKKIIIKIKRLFYKRAPHGITGYCSMKIQHEQPLPATIDLDAWYNEFDTMALCQLFGVPYETYKASQTNKS